MTPERFRQWIVILFAISIITVWTEMGLRYCVQKKRYVPRRHSGMPEHLRQVFEKTTEPYGKEKKSEGEDTDAYWSTVPEVSDTK